jgi:hypothetical protein
MAESTMQAGDDPKDYTNDQVNAYLADADETERRRVLEAEQGGEGRVGIVDGPHGYADSDGTLKGGESAGDGQTEGLAGTGNPNDLATRPEAQVSANIGHQEGAPEELTKVADESAAKGFFGENAAKPDYSQSNPEVMNGGENA